MNISKNNFLIRFINYFDEEGYYPKSLCSLFWTIIFTIILLPILITGKMFVALTRNLYGFNYKNEMNYSDFLLVGLLLNLVTWSLGFFLGGLIVDWVETLLILGLVVGVIAFIVVLVYMLDRMSDNDGNILSSGFSAIKSKTCPIIEYKD